MYLYILWLITKKKNHLKLKFLKLYEKIGQSCGVLFSFWNKSTGISGGSMKTFPHYLVWLDMSLTTASHSACTIFPSTLYLIQIHFLDIVHNNLVCSYYFELFKFILLLNLFWLLKYKFWVWCVCVCMCIMSQDLAMYPRLTSMWLFFLQPLNCWVQASNYYSYLTSFKCDHDQVLLVLDLGESFCLFSSNVGLMASNLLIRSKRKIVLLLL
jgi:hypothetical protein